MVRAEAVEPAQAPVAPVRVQEQNPDQGIEQALALRPANSLESTPPAFREIARAEQEDHDRSQQQHAKQGGENDGFKKYGLVRKHD